MWRPTIVRRKFKPTNYTRKIDGLPWHADIYFVLHAKHEQYYMYYLGLENITYNIGLFKDLGAQYSLTI